jgi:hypothetical protein
VVLALYRRGVQCPAEDVWALIGVISGMEEDIEALGPELTDFKKVEPLAFTLYSRGSHICIGHADEDVATAVVQDAAARLADFPRLPPRHDRNPN